MGNISSSTLFNFTDNIEHLLNNLEHGIYCHTSLEKLPGNRHAYEVPFCCFCDIPLSLISEHFEWYGEYGIGLKREYAREHNTQPVHYVTSESRFLKNITRKKTENISNNTKQYLIPYLKKFQGDQRHPARKRDKRKTFYDEREWRYVAEPEAVNLFFGKKSIEKRKEPIQNNHRFPLNLNKVEYIIVKDDKDVEMISKKLETIVDNKEVIFTSLISKIITAKQIRRDF